MTHRSSSSSNSLADSPTTPTCLPPPTAAHSVCVCCRLAPLFPPAARASLDLCVLPTHKMLKSCRISRSKLQLKYSYVHTHTHTDERFKIYRQMPQDSIDTIDREIESCRWRLDLTLRQRQANTEDLTWRQRRPDLKIEIQTSLLLLFLLLFFFCRDIPSWDCGLSSAQLGTVCALLADSSQAQSASWIANHMLDNNNKNNNNWATTCATFYAAANYSCFFCCCCCCRWILSEVYLDVFQFVCLLVWFGLFFFLLFFLIFFFCVLCGINVNVNLALFHFASLSRLHCLLSGQAFNFLAIELFFLLHIPCNSCCKRDFKWFSLL